MTQAPLSQQTLLSQQALPRRSPSVRNDEAPLTTGRGAALYIGALFGPGLLLLPGLAAAEAGPASVLAWAGLLVLSALFAAVFSALGRRFTSAGGVIGYVGAGLGARAATVTGWSFLAGVVAGAPVVCLIGAGYVTVLTGGGRPERALIAAALLIAVLALAAGGLRTSAGAQLVLVALLLVVVIVAVVGSAPASHAANWAPFAPHGWQAIGHAAATLMLSFVGWEAVAPLTARFADPARQLPRVVGIALAVTSAAYLGLAIATVSVLGTGAVTSAPLAALLRTAVGPAGTAAAAVAAVVLTLGAVNAYVTGAAAMTRELTSPAGGGARPAPRFLIWIAAFGFALIAAYGVGAASPAALVALPTTLFLVVYLGCMISAVRVLQGRARLAAVPAAAVVAVVLGYCGFALLAPLAVALAALVARPLAVALRTRGHAAAGRLPGRAPWQARGDPADGARGRAAELMPGHAAGCRRVTHPPPPRQAEPIPISELSRLCSDYPCRAGMSDPRRSV
jgi:amino acid efflux transporter